ncbi:MAG TPA: HAMP domain-containing sensor histidine kinase [Nocardioidaceae bacterium]|nr:HAMP domain-containing sensor histidine kinase [Nocardioidaceae bacterium]
MSAEVGSGLPPSERAADGVPRLRRAAAATPLRLRLVAALVVLMAIALAATGVAASATLSGYLMGRVDGQLNHALGPAIGRLLHDPAAARLGAGVYIPPSPYYVQATTAGGVIVARLTPPHTRTKRLPNLPALTLPSALAHQDSPYTVDSRDGSGQWRVLTTVLSDRSGSVTVAVSLADVHATLARLRVIELVAGLAVLLVLGALGYASVRSSLRPLVQMEATATAIAAGDLTLRAPARDPRTEVGRLSLAFNSMIAQIEMAFRARLDSERAARSSAERIRQFVADASHELRTPLTSIRGFAELERRRLSDGPPERAEVLQRIEAEATRMGLLVDDLMLLARLDEQRPLRRDPVDLLALATDLVGTTRVLHPLRSIDLEMVGGGRVPIVAGDEPRLRQALSNLVTNAVTHTPDEVPVAVRVGTDSAGGREYAVVEVTDNGPGLTAAEAQRVFERFYRTDPSRSRARGGSGLGLSIVQAIVGAHGGRVDLRTSPGTGATFRVTLPLAPDR